VFGAKYVVRVNACKELLEIVEDLVDHVVDLLLVRRARIDAKQSAVGVIVVYRIRTS
jgi:hypothetical protein